MVMLFLVLLPLVGLVLLFVHRDDTKLRGQLQSMMWYRQFG